jgi:hypothetical protein
MPATAAALSAHVQAVGPTERLKQATLYQTTGTEVDTTLLELICQKAINWFQLLVTTYDPDNYSLHQDIASLRVWQLLFERMGDSSAASATEAAMGELLGAVGKSGDGGRRSITSATNSQFTHEDVDREGTVPGPYYSPFSPRAFDDYRAQ